MSTRPGYHSPSRVDYTDLVNWSEKTLDRMKRDYPSLVRQGKLSAWTAEHNINTQEATVRLLKRFKKDPQTNLFEEFEKLK